MENILLKKLILHKLVETFPTMKPSEFDALVQDITLYGIKEPLWVINGNEIIDGRHRFLAAKKISLPEVPILQISSKEDPIKLIISANLHRRQLTPSQKAMVAAQQIEIKHGGNKNEEELTLYKAVKLFEVNKKYIKYAYKIINSSELNKKEKEELIQKVLSDEIPLYKAIKLLESKEIDIVPKQPLVDALVETSGNELQIKAIVQYAKSKGWSLEYLLKVITEYDEDTVRIGTAFKKAFDDNIYGIDGLATLVIDNLDVLIKEIKKGFL